MMFAAYFKEKQHKPTPKLVVEAQDSEFIKQIKAIMGDDGLDHDIDPKFAHLDNDEDDQYLSGKDRSYQDNEFGDDDVAAAGGGSNDGTEYVELAPASDILKKIMDFDMSVDPTLQLPDEKQSTGDEADADPEQEPEFQGMVRKIPGALLVSKKKTEDDTYTEIWMCGVDKNIETETKIRNQILSATDIDPNKNISEDGTQHIATTTLGNVKYFEVTGLPR